MKTLPYIAAISLGMILIGCASTDPARPGAFTREWAQDDGGTFRQTVEADDNDNGGGDRRAVIYRDEEGRTRVGVRDQGGFGADVDRDGPGTFLRFGYQHRFGGSRRMPEEAPPAEADSAE